MARTIRVYTIGHVATMIGESLQELLADIRTWDGGIHQFLVDEQCDPAIIERIMAREAKA